MNTDTRQRGKRLRQFLANRRAVLKGGAAAALATAMPSFSRSARAAPSKPMHFIGWQYNPQIVSENVDTFKKLYDENVDYELVPGEYHAIAETKLMAGQHIDMMYSEEDHIVRWNKAGWTRTLDGLPGLDGGRQAVADGKLSVTFVYPTGGREAVDVAERIFKGERVPHKIVLPTLMITKENALTAK